MCYASFFVMLIAGLVWTKPSGHNSNNSERNRIILGTLVRCGDTERWPPGLWPDKIKEGVPATADGGVSLPLLEPGPHRCGCWHHVLAMCCFVHLGPAPPRPQCLLVEERAQPVLTPLVV